MAKHFISNITVGKELLSRGRNTEETLPERINNIKNEDLDFFVLVYIAKLLETINSKLDCGGRKIDNLKRLIKKKPRKRRRRVRSI